jgi:hypothetical protein
VVVKQQKMVVFEAVAAAGGAKEQAVLSMAWRFTGTPTGWIAPSTAHATTIDCARPVLSGDRRGCC